jgi:hypothetical protein
LLELEKEIVALSFSKKDFNSSLPNLTRQAVYPFNFCPLFLHQGFPVNSK